ncbi:MAG: DUF4830 domain-containing protein [Oscillibacter sp.]|jgi:hypothetical protein|nr:DUF4830 domain-containing protein [Oscillibacter sp.]
MFILTARISKKRVVLLTAAAILAAVLLLYLFHGLRNAGTEQASRLADNEDRVDYLETWGWEVDPEPLETFQLLLPEKLQEPYLSYNELQKEQGFDLSDCCGKQVERYTYAVLNYPDRPDGVQVNLYVCGGMPAAGDIIAGGADGFQAGLAFPEKTDH